MRSSSKESRLSLASRCSLVHKLSTGCAVFIVVKNTDFTGRYSGRATILPDLNKRNVFLSDFSKGNLCDLECQLYLVVQLTAYELTPDSYG